MPQISMTCEYCGGGFLVRPYRKDTACFCSRTCRARGRAEVVAAKQRGRPKPSSVGNTYRKGLRPANSFESGHEPWNKNVKGIHLSPKTEFKPGPRPEKRAAIGTVSFRRTHDGNMRAFVKVEHPNKWKQRAVKVWEDANGPVPKGKVIHHDDRDTLNDDLGNLHCLTKAEHMLEHKDDLSHARALSFARR